ncbi:hypothetical protein ABT381_20955 [Streptomyces sp. NPDC000151]|uniref:alpha/beta hydrolase n=1 Tax=Streptomyces sp. NPDC000151 TaxID=3154244 RepID=UPI00332607A8
MTVERLPNEDARAAPSVPVEAAVTALAAAFKTTLKAASRRRVSPELPGGPDIPRSSWREGGQETPIVLVPGYLSAEGCWGSLVRRLRQSGYHRTSCLRYNSLRMPIPDVAELVAEEASAAARRSGTQGVHLIGYSLGGLAVRYAVQRLGTDADALSAITIATPHRGAPLAYAAPGPAAKQMRVRSPLLGGLPPIDSDGRVRWLLVGSTSDLVVPISSATAGRHVDSVSIPDCGHLNIIDTPQLADAVIGHLAYCRTQRRTPQSAQQKTPQVLAS